MQNRDRAIGRRCDPVVDALVRDGNREGSVRRRGDGHFGEVGLGQAGSLDQIGQRLEGRARRISLGRVAKAKLDCLACSRKPGIADAGSAKARADIVDHCFEPRLDDIVPFDLQRDLRSALKIEAEHHLLLGKPVRQAGQRRGWYRVGHSHQNAEQHDEPDDDGFPAGKIRHEALEGMSLQGGQCARPPCKLIP